MKFEFTKITEAVDLGEYHVSYQGQVVHVWVNPPKSVRREREGLLRLYAGFFRQVIDETPTRKPLLGRVMRFFIKTLPTEQEKRLQEAQRKVYGWFAQLWSQHTDTETHWSVYEISELNETDPALYAWLIGRSVLKIDTFRIDKKK